MSLFGSVFGPALLISIGVVLIIKYAFNLNFPTGRVIFGLVVLFLGLSMLFEDNHGFIDKNNNIFFYNDRITVTNLEDEYNIIFSNGTIDLSDISVSEKKRVKINCIFSKGTVFIDEDAPIIVEMNSAFGSIDAPDGTDINFGDYTYMTEAARRGQAAMEIEADAVFGKLEIVEK